MTADRSADYLASLLHELCTLPRETEWVEFKVNEVEPQGIGEYISALANSAALVGKAFAYLMWGVRDDDHAVVGTSFDPHAARVGNEELESWLLRLLEPKLDFRYFTVDIDGHRVVLLEIARAARHPVRFSGQEFNRYLIQHSAGSGKSNSIAWLAHQLIGLKRDEKEVFDSVIVVTDRRLLDQQIQTTIKQFMQVGATVGHAERSGDLRKFIEQGKKIIVSTVQKFPFILDEIATEGGKTFAIVEQVMAAGKIGGQARAMVVTSGIERAIQYFHAFKTYLVERKSPYQAIVAFSGEHTYQGAKVTPHTARMAHDQALGKVMQLLLKDDTQVYKQFVENESFRRSVSDMVYAITAPSGPSAEYRGGRGAWGWQRDDWGRELMGDGACPSSGRNGARAIREKAMGGLDQVPPTKTK